MSLWNILNRYLLKPTLSVLSFLPGQIVRGILLPLINGQGSNLPEWWPDLGRNHKYPHLLPRDVIVWERFLEDHRRSFNYFDYDIRVGEGRPAPSLPTAGLRKMATDLSQRRIDAVGHFDGTRTVIEITHTLGLKAIGQIQSYPILYRTKYPGDYKLNTLLVADVIESDMIQALLELQIPFWTPDRSHLMNLILKR